MTTIKIASATPATSTPAPRDLSYKHAGGPVGVLLMHGLCGTPAEMRYVANGLSRAGYTVHVPQLAGHGGSDADMKASTWQDWYKSGEDALLELRKTCSTVIVGGLSTGSMLSLLLAARHPDKVQAITLFSPTLWVNGWTVPWYARLFKLIRSKAIANMIPFPDLHPHGIKDPRIRDYISKLLASGNDAVAGNAITPGGAVLEHRWLVDQVKPLLGKITQPALIIHPREDDLAGLGNTAYLQRQLAGMVDTVVLNDSYHNITIDRQRQTVTDRTLAFVERIVKEAAKVVNARPVTAMVPAGMAQAA